MLPSVSHIQQALSVLRDSLDNYTHTHAFRHIGINDVDDDDDAMFVRSVGQSGICEARSTSFLGRSRPTFFWSHYLYSNLAQCVRVFVYIHTYYIHRPLLMCVVFCFRRMDG